MEVSPWKTSITCNACGHEDKQSRDRLSFKCTKCGHTDHADTNAAKNIRVKGRIALHRIVAKRSGILSEKR